MSGWQDPACYSRSIPALSVRQPWAELIVSGRKRMEIRPWITSYRGPLWIHASQTMDEDAAERFDIAAVPRGSFVGGVIVEACVSVAGSRWARTQDYHLSGRDPPRYDDVWGWILRDPVRFTEAIKGRGKLRLFYPTASIAVRLNEAFRTAAPHLLASNTSCSDRG